MVRNPGAGRRLSAEQARRGLSLRFVSEVVGELRRVTWPTRDEAMRLTLMVVAVSAAIGVFLGAIDIGFARLFTEILGSSSQ